MKKVWTLLVFAFLFASCERDADIPLPKADPKLGLFAFLSPGSPIEVMLVKVKPIFGSGPNTGPEYIPNGTIVLSDGTDTSILVLEPGGKFYVEPVPKLIIQKGRTYSVWASAPGLPSVSASCVVPKQGVNTHSINHYGSLQGDDSSFQLSMFWQDLPGQDNFYRVTAESIDSLNNSGFNSYPFGFNSNFQTDFSNDGKVLQSGIGTYQTSPVDVRTRWVISSLITCETHYYRYHLNLETTSGGNPFVEPSSLYSNVKDGVGCFGAYIQHTDKIRIF